MTVCVVCSSDCPGVKAARLFEAYCSFRSNIPGIKHPKGAAICLFSSIRPDTNKYKPSRQQRNSRFGGFYSLGRQLSIRREIVEISAPQSANNGQIHPTKDKKSRNNSRLSSFRRYSVACIITRSVPRHSFTATVILPMDWMILAASGSRTTEIGCVAAVIALPLVVTSWRSAR